MEFMYVSLLLSGLLLAGVNADCYSVNDCATRVASYESSWNPFGCRWCPLTRSCHAPGSRYNDCKDDHQITNDSTLSCETIAEPSLSYSSVTAETMARWSSLAYVTPAVKDMEIMQSIVQAEFGANYRIIEFLLNSCDVILWKYRHCGAVIAISDVDNHIVVAFRGTFETTQLVEQALGLLTGMTESPIGGEVLRYNENTHDKLYPCIKSIIEEQVHDNPSLRVSVTGHSLGGAQATLIAAHLIFDKVVSSSKLELYTFGAPRVGDRDFAFEFDRLIGNSWRITKKDDPVVQAVPSSLFKLLYFAYHTRREVFYNTDKDITSETSYIICRGNEDNLCVRSHYLCVTSSCTDEHNNYFLTNLPVYIQNKISKGVPPPQGMRDECTSFIFSK